MDRIIKVVLRGDLGNLPATLRTAKGLVVNTAEALTGAEKEAVKFREGLTTVGTAATRTGLVAAAGVGLITKAAIDWESAWAGVTKTINGTPAQLSAIESGLRDMARELPSSHEELAGIAEAAGQLGVQTPNILAFTRVMADLAQTTNLTADEAATSIAQFMNVMQTAPEDVDNLGAALVALGNNGASTERDIIQMAQNIAGAGAVVGASEADVLALANALASVGIDAEAGGSAVSRVLIDMSTAVQTNSDQLQTWAAVAGKSTKDFADEFRTAPIEAFNDFTMGLGRIDDAGGDVFSTLSSLGQVDIRVTRALLGMAKSGDVLSDSLALGSKAWKDNTALAQEAEKRYDTTAAKARVAWNDIKDSAIDAGQGMLPVVASIAEGIGDATGAFGALPGPVKSSVGVLGAFGAGSLLAVGSVIKLVTSISTAREAMENLSVTSPQLAGSLGRIGKAAGLAAAALIALKVAGKFTTSTDVASVNKFTVALLDAADGAKGAKKNLDELAQADPSELLDIFPSSGGVDNLKEAFSAAGDGAASFLDKLTPYQDRGDKARQVIDQIDASLTSLVTSGAADRAGDVLDYLAEATGRSTSEIKKLLPEYTNALSGVEVQQRITGDSTDDFGKKLEDLSPAAQEAKEKLDQLKQATVDAALSFDAFDDNLDTNKKSFQDYIKGLEEMADAQENWAENLIKATARGVDEGVIDKFQKMGPEGAKRLAELADASDKEIARVNKAFRSTVGVAGELSEILNDIPASVLTSFKTPGAKDAIDTAVELAAKYDLTPDEVETIMEALDYASGDIKKVKDRLKDLDGDKARVKVTADTRAARQAIRDIQNALANLPGLARVSANVPANPTLRASGGPIYGPGTSTSDSIPALLSNGEYVVKASAVSRYGRTFFDTVNAERFSAGGLAENRVHAGFVAAMNAQRLASGGPVQAIPAPVAPVSFSASLVGARARLVGPDLVEFVDGRIQLGISGEQNYAASKRRSGR